ncbi:MAG: HlyD family efflux transporter periplasmic adaptor subunit [Cyanobacteria bacterium RI_101]|nr:HlyD family efflux transporter periplasmic adaptor subunit [Cyanobacteria bacterium RI_101]
MGKPADPSRAALPASSLRWIILALVVGGAATAGIIIYGLRGTPSQTVETAPQTKPAPENRAVSALGRIAPAGEIFKLAPAPTMGGAKVVKVLVSEGDRVKTGQVVAVLDNYDREMAAVITAREEVKVAKANLDIVAAGAKTGEIQAQAFEVERNKAEFPQELSRNQAALDNLVKQLEGEKLEQKATIDRLGAEERQAQQDYRRYRILAEEGAIPLADLEQRNLAVVSAKQRLKEAQARLLKTEATLEERIREQKSLLERDATSKVLQAREAQANLARIKEIRPVDVEKAKAELNLALARFQEAKAELDTAVIRAPMDAQILKIYTRPGEKVSDTDGFADLGRTDQMMVVAEVYENDITKIRPGQRALIKSENESFPGELEGEVRVIGYKVGKKDVLDSDPAADIDARVIEVKILLSPEASREVARLSNANVLVQIQP